MVVSDRLWKEVMFLDNFTCVYCGRRDHNLTIDHFIPSSIGGPDIIQNLVAACGECNTTKGARAPYECKLAPRFGRYAYVGEQFVQGTIQGRVPSYSMRGFAALMGIPETTLRRKLAQLDEENDK